MQESNSVNIEIISRDSSKEINLPDIIDEAKIKEVINTFCKDLSKINSLDEFGWTPLYRTIIAGDLNSSQILITKGANPNIKCSMGETPLYQAVDMGKLDHVKLLIKMGANPNIPQDDGFTPLHAAVTRENILIVKYLLKNGANPNIKSKLFNHTPVHLSIKNNVDPMIMLLLVQFNGSLLEEDKFGKRPIDYVCSKEMGEAIEKLKFGKNPNKKLVLYPLVQTPKKYNNWAITKAYSNTIRSNTSIGDLNLKSNTVLKGPGSLKNSIIGTNSHYNKYKKLNSTKNFSPFKNKKNIKNSSNSNKEILNISKENENNIEFELEKENDEPNLRKIKLSFNTKEESSFYESDKGENNSLTERMSIKNNNYNDKDNLENSKLLNAIFPSKLIKLKNNKNDKKQKVVFIKNNNNCSKIPKKKLYIRSINDKKKISNSINSKIKKKNNNYKFIQIYGNSKAKKGSFSINTDKQRKIKDQTMDINNYKDFLSEKKCKANNYLYIKPIFSLDELSAKKLSLSQNNINYFIFNTNNKNNNKDIKNYNTNINNNKNITNNNNNDIKHQFTFMDNDSITINNNNKEESNKFLFGNKKKIKKSRNENNDNYFSNINSNSNMDCESKSYSISIINSNRNNSSILNDSSINNFLWKFKSIEDDNIFHNKKISDNTSTTTCSYNIDITNSNALYPIYEWLKEINLTCYYKLFIEKRIYNLDKIM